MKKILISAVLLAAASLAACTDAERASFTALGDQSSITCYSGGEVIFTDESTGKVQQLDGDGITYLSAKTRKYVRAFADCIVTNK